MIRGDDQGVILSTIGAQLFIFKLTVTFRKITQNIYHHFIPLRFLLKKIALKFGIGFENRISQLDNT